MSKRAKLEEELAKLKAEIDDAEEPDEPDDEGEPDEEPEPKKRAADVAKKAGEAAKRKKATEIDGVSESTMQAFLEETRKVRKLLEGGKITPAKAGSLFDSIASALGFDADDGEEEEEAES